MDSGYAGFWRRAAAALIDGFVLGTFLAALLLYLSYALKIPSLTQTPISWSALTVTIAMVNWTFEYGVGCIFLGETILAAIGLVIFYLTMGHVAESFWLNYCLLVITPMFLNWLYHALMESSAKQATLGKMLLKLKVTDLNGQRISFWKATVRHFSKILSTLILLVGYLMVGWTKKKQALHDKIAGCLVVRQ